MYMYMYMYMYKHMYMYMHMQYRLISENLDLQQVLSPCFRFPAGLAGWDPCRGDIVLHLGTGWSQDGTMNLFSCFTPCSDRDRCSCRVVSGFQTVPRKQVLEVPVQHGATHWHEKSICTLCSFLHLVLEYPFLTDVKSQPSVWTGNASDQSNDVQAGCFQCRIQHGIYNDDIFRCWWFSVSISAWQRKKAAVSNVGCLGLRSCAPRIRAWNPGEPRLKMLAESFTQQISCPLSLSTDSATDGGKWLVSCDAFRATHFDIPHLINLVWTAWTGIT